MGSIGYIIVLVIGVALGWVMHMLDEKERRAFERMRRER